MQRDFRVSLDDDLRLTQTGHRFLTMGMTGTPHLRPYNVATAMITRRRRRLGGSHICMIDPENTFDTSDHAADSTADDGADRAGDPVSLVGAMHNTSRHALSIRRDCHHHEHCRRERYTELHYSTPATSWRSGQSAIEH
jgi:hypothetical protein